MVWLIGCEGMLGKDLWKQMKRHGIDCFVSGREVDITDRECLKAFPLGKEIRWIINCAAYTAVESAEREKETAYRVNKTGAANVAAIADELGTKLIHISTDYVFDGNSDKGYLEEDAANPINVYGKSKWEGELAVSAACRKYFIVRTAWLYGAQGDNFIFTMLKLFQEKKAVRVVMDQFGTPTFTEDLAEFLIRIILQERDEYGIYHFTNMGGKISWYDFSRAIYKIALERGILEFGTEVEIWPISSCDYPAKVVRPTDSYLSKKKVLNTFQFSIPVWEDGLKRFFSLLAGS